MSNSITGIEYQNTNVRGRSRLNGYHQSPPPIWLNKTPYNVDLRGLKPSEKRRVLTFEGGEFNSNYCVGFEIEKSYFYRNADFGRGDNIGELALFKGFELDGSCGVEAISHVLPLLPSGQWRNKVYDMFFKAKEIINDEFSPSSSDCGGHITLSCRGMSSRDLFDKVRKYSGLIMSLYRVRLVNGFCRYNMTMSAERSGYRNGTQGTCISTGSHYKYQFCKLGDNSIEFRVPPRVQSVKQLMRRYELFYELIDCAVNGVSYRKFLTRVKPILNGMFPEGEDKVKIILRDAKYFQRFIDSNGERTHETTDVFIDCITEDLRAKRSEWIRGNYATYLNS